MRINNNLRHILILQNSYINIGLIPYFNIFLTKNFLDYSKKEQIALI